MQKSIALSASGPKPRGRPRGFDRDAALAAAMALFRRRGYEAASLAELTQAMGIGAPSLYAAFGSKEALFREALASYVDRFEGVIWDRFGSATTARGAIEAYLLDSAAALGGACGGGGCMVTLSAIAGDDHAGLAGEMRAHRAAMLARVRGRLARAAADGEIGSGVDLDALAGFVQAVQNGLSIQARDGAAPEALIAAARMAMRGWAAYVGPAEGTPIAG